LILEKQIVDTSQQSTKELPKEWRTSRVLTLDNRICDIKKRVATCNCLNNFFYRYVVFVSQVEPKSIKEALLDEHWLLTMQEELTQFKINEVWDLCQELMLNK